MSKRCYPYQSKFLDYGFTDITVNGIIQPQCVLCLQVLCNNALKDCKLKRHLETMHSKHCNEPRSFFERHEKVAKRQRLDAPQQRHAVHSLRDMNMASLHVAWRVARCKKAHTIAEDLIKPAAIDMVKCIGGDEIVKKLQMIPLSNNTIQRRISMISEDICNQVIECIKQSGFFSLQLDESTDCSDAAQLLVYSRYQGNDDMQEEFLFCLPFTTTTTGEDIFNLVDNFFSTKGLSWNNCMAVTTDGAPAMKGVRKGFCARVKLVNPTVIITHCMLHRENLVAKKLQPQLNKVMHDVIEVVNFIKGRSLNSRLFRKLCADFAAEHDHLLFYSEVRWLSRGEVLRRVVELKAELYTFLTEKDHHLASCLNDTIWLCQLCYLNDIFTHLNQLNASMQGPNANLVDTSEKITCFQQKIKLWRGKMERDLTAAFPTLALWLEDNPVLETVKPIFLDHLQHLDGELKRYMPDTYESFSWVRNPFSTDVLSLENVADGVQEELLEMQNDGILRDVFKSLSLTKFWVSVASEKPVIFNAARTILLPFSTTYLCEAGFSALTTIKSKSRNRLDPKNDMCCALTSLYPRFNELCDTIQGQGAH